MATIAANSYPLEFNFIDNPIVVGIENMSFPAESTFRQIVIEVVVTPTYSYESTTYLFRISVSAESIIWVDISTALRSAMNGWHPTPEMLTSNYMKYKYAAFTLKAWEEYLYDGDIYKGDYVSRVSAYAFYGGMSEYERLTIQTHPADFIDGKILSRKPKDGALWGTNDFVITNEAKMNSSGAAIEIVGSYERIANGFLPAGQYRHFMFVNSLGVLETCSAWCRESLSYNISSEKKSLVTTPSFHPAPNLTTHKTGNRPHMEMSSGPVSVEWADWWTTEFLMAKRYWVYMGTTKKLSTDENPSLVETPLWLPCVVIPSDDNTVVYDKAEQNYPHVNFDVEIAVSGSLMSTLL